VSEVGQAARGAAILPKWELPASVKASALITAAPAGAQQEQGTTILQDRHHRIHSHLPLFSNTWSTV